LFFRELAKRFCHLPIEQNHLRADLLREFIGFQLSDFYPLLLRTGVGKLKIKLFMLESLNGYELTWRFANGESLTKMRHQYHCSYDYIHQLIGEWLSAEQIKDIIYFQRHPDAPKRLHHQPKKATFKEKWEKEHSLKHATRPL